MFRQRYYQEESAQKAFEAWKKGGDPVIGLPTASGKTAVISRFIELVVNFAPTTKITVLSHNQEIVKQIHNALSKVFHGMPVGLWSASLGEKDERTWTVAQIQSAYRRTKNFVGTQLFIVDEAHAVGFDEKTMYRKMFARFPDASFVGCTATPFRTGGGYIYEGERALFSEICIDWTRGDNYMRLVDEGYLTPIFTIRPDNKHRVGHIPEVGGDFNQKYLSKTVDIPLITRRCVAETIKHGLDGNYKRWLIFAIDIKHAEHIKEAFISQGISACCVHSKMEGESYQKVMADTRKGKYRAIVNVDMLTTGYDDTEIDLIAMMRATCSPIIHVQAPGRGARPHYVGNHDLDTIEGRLAAIKEGKPHCLLLDFGGNLERLGPLNDPVVRRPGQKAKDAPPPPMKTCPECKTYNYPSARRCVRCGHEFVFQEKITSGASESVALQRESEKPKPEPVAKPIEIEGIWHDVEEVGYSIHRKPGKANAIKVIYHCPNRLKFHEYVCLEHGGAATGIAKKWIREHGGDTSEIKNTSDLWKALANFKVACKVKVTRNGPYWNVCDKVLA